VSGPINSLASLRSKWAAGKARNYSRKITLETIKSFKGVLDDVGPGKGIMVTKTGYQSGARKFAQHYGISLKLLQSPKPEDLERMRLTIPYDRSLVMPLPWCSLCNAKLEGRRERNRLRYSAPNTKPEPVSPEQT
jgi:Restriction endonuclease